MVVLRLRFHGRRKPTNRRIQRILILLATAVLIWRRDAYSYSISQPFSHASLNSLKEPKKQANLVANLDFA